jgi:transglutaminase-like putative cysteine protease
LRIRTLAKSLGSYENAYLYVRDKIENDASIPALPAGDILEEGRASCFGKAIVLCSLYRTMGKPASDVRIVIGEADLPSGGFDHAWIELEHNGKCLQQDTTNVLGQFDFGQFHNTKYVETFIRDEEFVLNDKSFAIVSQLNRLKGSGHPQL